MLTDAIRQSTSPWSAAALLMPKKVQTAVKI